METPIDSIALQQVDISTSVLEMDAQCQELVGQQFRNTDDDLCVISHWDTECGLRRIIYAPVIDPDEVQTSTLPEV